MWQYLAKLKLHILFDRTIPLWKFLLQIYIYTMKHPVAMKMKDVDLHDLICEDMQDTWKKF